jgi:hypothetical protein
MATSTTQPAVQTATFWKLALAVFVGNLMTGALVALIYAFVADNRGLFH